MCSMFQAPAFRQTPYHLSQCSVHLTVYNSIHCLAYTTSFRCRTVPVQHNNNNINTTVQGRLMYTVRSVQVPCNQFSQKRKFHNDSPGNVELGTASVLLKVQANCDLSRYCTYTENTQEKSSQTSTEKNSKKSLARFSSSIVTRRVRYELNDLPCSAGSEVSSRVEHIEHQ